MAKNKHATIEELSDVLFPRDSICYLFFVYLDTGHLLITPNSSVIIVKEGSEAVLPCKPNRSETNVTLHREFLDFEVVSTNSLYIDN
jgi:hypothetical protein